MKKKTCNLEKAKKSIKNSLTKSKKLSLTSFMRAKRSLHMGCDSFVGIEQLLHEKCNTLFIKISERL